MDIIIHVDVRKLDKNTKLALDEYIKRTSPYCRITLKTYKDISKAGFKNGSKLYNVIPGPDSPTSPGLAKLIENDNMCGFSCIEFIVKDCASTYHNNEEKVYETSDNKDIHSFNLSSFSMSQELTAIVLTEQIYRAYTIMNNITYHK